MHLDFLNKNLYRKYPLRAESTSVFTSGVELPQNLLCALQISAPYSFSDLYISQIYATDNFISIVVNEYNTDVVVGTIQGAVTQDLTVLYLEATLPTISGKLIIGQASSLAQIAGSNYLAKADGRIEASCILSYTPPAVSKITNDEHIKTGNIGFILDNLTLNTDTSVHLGVDDVSLITSNNDFNGALNNCGLPIITKINTVSPDNVGNIDIYGILPVSIEIGTGEIGLLSELTIDEVCPERTPLVPPVDNTDVYHTDILTATAPEWKSWPNLPT